MARNVSGANKWVAITPHNTNLIPGGSPSAIVVGVGGTVCMVDQYGNEMIRTFVAEVERPYQPVIIKVTGTTATGIYGLWN
jgi:hypothetical protein